MKKSIILLLLFISLFCQSQNSIGDLSSYDETKYKTLPKDSTKKLLLVGLNNFDYNFLYEIGLTFMVDYKYDFEIDTTNIDIKNYLIGDSISVNADSLISDYHSEYITIFMVNKNLIYKNFVVNGLSHIINKTIIVDGNNPDFYSTIVHELGHIYGLKHCEDNYCTMSYESTNTGSFKFCEKCQLSFK
jgi:hypothetical protein